MTKWEYMYVSVDGPVGGTNVFHPKSANGVEVKGWKSMTIHDYSNWLGQQGWELVGTLSTYTVIFKRPLP